jgi:hypothetical protein
MLLKLLKASKKWLLNKHFKQSYMRGFCITEPSFLSVIFTDSSTNELIICFVIQCFISIFTKGACLILCGLRSALPLARARKPNNHIAQGSALGIIVYIINNAPCKGNTLIIRLLPLQGVWVVCVF